MNSKLVIPQQDWRLYLKRRPKTDEVLPLIENFELILENDPLLKGKIGFNEFNYMSEKTSSLPWWKFREEKTEWTDMDDNGLAAYIEKTYHFYNKDKMRIALGNVINRNSFHPIKDRIQSVTWDHVSRIESFFIDYFGAEDTPYTRAVSRKMFTAAVTRIYKPGSKFDYVIVLTGKQGIGKTFTINRLAYDKWANDLSTFHDKQAVESIVGSWLVEIGEMAALKKSESEEQKQFITRTYDRVRMAYARHPERYLRQCIFIGSGNETFFLRDMTGNRRWWPIDCDPAKRTKNPLRELSYKIVDQLWAEALILFRHGETLFLDEELELMAFEEQQAHQLKTDEEIRIEQFLESPVWEGYHKLEPTARLSGPGIGQELIQRSFTCNAEIWEVGLGRDRNRMNRQDQIRIGNIVRALGWTQPKKPKKWDSHYGTQRYYTR